MAAVAYSLLALSALLVASLLGAEAYSCTCTGCDYGGALPPEPADPCTIGPDYWCLDNNLAKCNLEFVKNIGTCHYSSGICKVEPSLQYFCQNDTTAYSYGGGIINMPPGNFQVLVLALYWAPTSCLSNQTTGGGFCSAYTTKGTIGAQYMDLHGLWPDFSSTYGTPNAPQFPPPSEQGAYQGWTQYCSAADFPGAVNYTNCHVNGNLCPLPNITSQTAYEQCMRQFNVKQCITDESIVQKLKPQLAELAPGYLGADRTFIDHEFAKHGSCVGTYFVKNKTAYFEAGLDLARRTRYNPHGVPALVHKYRGQAVNTSTITKILGKKAVPRCTSSCQLSEIWYCYGRDAAGFPTEPIVCTPGTQGSDSCSVGIYASNNCSQIIIPDFELGPYLAP